MIDLRHFRVQIALVLTGLRAMIGPLLLAFGEGVVGLIPVLTPPALHKLLAGTPFMIACTTAPKGCSLLAGQAEEANIVTVVISGLALLSLIPFGPKHRTAQLTPITYLAALTELLFLVLATILYVMNKINLDVGDEPVSLSLLAIALLLSFYMTGEEAWLEAVGSQLGVTGGPAANAE